MTNPYSIYDDEYYDEISKSEVIKQEKSEKNNNDKNNSNNTTNKQNTDRSDKNNETAFSYDPYMFVSRCCNAFVFYDNINVCCSKCAKEIYKLKDDENIVISIKYNNNTELTGNIDSENKMSGDILQSFYNKLARYSTDPVCELCSKKCNKCNSLMRYLRDPQGNIVYVCSNGDCRNTVY